MLNRVLYIAFQDVIHSFLLHLKSKSAGMYLKDIHLPREFPLTKTNTSISNRTYETTVLMAHSHLGLLVSNNILEAHLFPSAKHQFNFLIIIFHLFHNSSTNVISLPVCRIGVKLKVDFKVISGKNCCSVKLHKSHFHKKAMEKEKKTPRNLQNVLKSSQNFNQLRFFH